MKRLVSPASVLSAYRAKLDEELRGEWAVVLLYRPVSLLLAPALVALRVPPMGVTLAAVLLALSLPWMAIAAPPPPHRWVAIGAIAFCILDCLDGDVARVTGRASARGAYADFAADLLYRACFYAALGYLAGAAGGAAIGLAAAWLSVAARGGRLYVEARRGVARPAPAHGLYSFLSGLDHLSPLLLILAGLLGRIEWLLAWVVLYSLADFLVTQVSVLRALR